MLEKRLSSEGYSVVTVDNGFDVLALAKAQPPDLIILDLVMPSMEGGEIAAKIKGDIRTRNVPIIFLTALLSKDEEYKENHIIAGNITFAKPIDTEGLLSQIRKLLL